MMNNEGWLNEIISKNRGNGAKKVTDSAWQSRSFVAHPRPSLTTFYRFIQTSRAKLDE
jgi:hypothetical protein